MYLLSLFKDDATEVQHVGRLLKFTLPVPSRISHTTLKLDRSTAPILIKHLKYLFFLV